MPKKIYFLLQSCKIYDNHQFLQGFCWVFLNSIVEPYKNQNLFFPAKMNGSALLKKYLLFVCV